MISLEHVISIVVLNCGYTSPSIEKERGQYDDIFASLLLPAAERVSARIAKTTKLKFNIKGYDTVKQVYPLTLQGIDAIIISGSPNGAYQDLEWIRKLDGFVSYVYHEHPSIKLYGHPEFDQFINTECLKLVGKRVGWDADFTSSAIAAARARDDAAIAADIMVAFFLDMEPGNV
ncbi:hypothetical protein NKR23_g9379 [Pleurostoma richardsiae]|uniref:Uncharacterized protein n=1 Tax=Pleurostoma richardsiae TaxID=41990 RepID=A0AA38RFY7_9PEZI|nr:hypothetical protein NKR23_g9379 [Pleurostoma richardsiae]